MRSNGKFLRLAIFSALLSLLTAGCGGLRMSKSVSPLDFFLPGLLQADPPPAQPDPATPADEEPLQQIAQN